MLRDLLELNRKKNWIARTREPVSESERDRRESDKKQIEDEKKN